MSDLLLDFSQFSNKNTENILKKPTHKKKKSIKNTTFAKNDELDSLSSKDIQYSLSLRFLNHSYIIYNAYIFNWESDFFSVSDSEYLYEIEIKVTRSDFKDDFQKKDKHILLESTDNQGFPKKPNKFFYACPKGLLSTYEIPSYAGLIEISSRTSTAVVVKDAPFLHKEKILPEYKTILLDKFYNRYRDLILEKNL